MAGFNHQHQAHRRLFQFNCGFRVQKLRAINDIRPINEFLEIGQRVVESVLYDRSDVLCAGLITGIVELFPAGIVAKVPFVFG